MLFEIPVFLWTIFMAMCSSILPLMFILALVTIFIRFGKKMYRGIIR